jgi:type IV secretion system protein TrbL
MITIQFLVAMVESYIVVAAGFIFLGFGGSRWTVPYAERYIGLAVSNGVKILVIYLLIAVGTNLGNAWVAEAQGASTSASPEMVAFDVMAAALMYMMLCWQIPKLFSAVLGGSPALSGGDFIAAGTSLVVGAGAIASAAAGGAGVLAGGARALGGVGTAASAGTGSALSISRAGDMGSTGMGGGSVPPPPGPSGSGQGSGFGNPRQPEPPSNSGASGETSPPNGSISQAAGAAGKAQDTLGSVSTRMRNLGRRLNSVVPPDHAPHSTPPRMDIEHHE